MTIDAFVDNVKSITEVGRNGRGWGNMHGSGEISGLGCGAGGEGSGCEDGFGFGYGRGCACVFIGFGSGFSSGAGSDHCSGGNQEWL